MKSSPSPLLLVFLFLGLIGSGSSMVISPYELVDIKMSPVALRDLLRDLKAFNTGERKENVTMMVSAFGYSHVVALSGRITRWDDVEEELSPSGEHEPPLMKKHKEKGKIERVCFLPQEFTPEQLEAAEREKSDILGTPDWTNFLEKPIMRERIRDGTVRAAEAIRANFGDQDCAEQLSSSNRVALQFCPLKEVRRVQIFPANAVERFDGLSKRSDFLRKVLRAPTDDLSSLRGLMRHHHDPKRRLFAIENWGRFSPKHTRLTFGGRFFSTMYTNGDKCKDTANWTTVVEYRCNDFDAGSEHNKREAEEAEPFEYSSAALHLPFFDKEGNVRHGKTWSFRKLDRQCLVVLAVYFDGICSVIDDLNKALITPIPCVTRYRKSEA